MWSKECRKPQKRKIEGVLGSQQFDRNFTKIEPKSHESLKLVFFSSIFRGREYRGGSSDSWGDPPQIKVLYVLTSKSNLFFKLVKIHLLAPFWSSEGWKIAENTHFRSANSLFGQLGGFYDSSGPFNGYGNHPTAQIVNLHFGNVHFQRFFTPDHSKWRQHLNFWPISKTFSILRSVYIIFWFEGVHSRIRRYGFFSTQYSLPLK